jgi:hypothetical protein
MKMGHAYIFGMKAPLDESGDKGNLAGIGFLD